MPRKATEVEGAVIGAIYNIKDHGSYKVTKVRNGPREPIVEIEPADGDKTAIAGDMGLSLFKKMAKLDWRKDSETYYMLYKAADRMRQNNWPEYASKAILAIINQPEGPKVTTPTQEEIDV